MANMRDKVDKIVIHTEYSELYQGLVELLSRLFPECETCIITHGTWCKNEYTKDSNSFQKRNERKE